MAIYGLVVLAFLAAFSVLFLLFYLLIPKKSIVQERLDSMAVTAPEMALMEPQPTQLAAFLRNIGGKIPLKAEYQGKYVKMLVAAGIRREKLPLFIGTKILLTVALPLTYLLSYGLLLEKDYIAKMLLSFMSAIAGYLLPSIWLSQKIKKRQLSIFHQLPDVLDLLTICVESGLGLDAALIRVSNDPQFKGSPLTQEIMIAMQETRSGKPRSEALRDMGERTMIDDLKSFSAMLIQTERLGTSLAQSLRVHAESLRTIRRQKAEEQAAKMTVKLLFPLIFFILPALFVIMLVPAFLRAAKYFTDV